MNKSKISVIGALIAVALLATSSTTLPAAANAQRGLKPKIVQLVRDAAVNGFTVETINNTFQFRAINVRHPDTGKPLGGRHDAELLCNVPFVKRLFFNKGNSERTRVKCLLVVVTPRIIINEE
ncbi:MAG: hypothetical protein AB1631_01680 [Acidobacteriota bacterium]